MKRAGFTLIELLVVISIVALLSSVVLAQLNSAREKGRLAAGKQFDANLYHALADQALGVWDFDECALSSAADRSGNNLNGALLNFAAPMWSSDTPNGSKCSILFNGSNQGVSVGTVDLSASSDFTYSTWIKVNNFQAASPFISSVMGGESPGTAVLRLGDASIANNRIQFNVGGTRFNGATGLQAGVWYHVAAVKEGTKGTIYLNGSLDGTGSLPAGAGPTMAFGIGYNPLNGRFLDGFMDGTRVYGKSLTATEIRSLYAEGLPTHSLASSASAR